MCLKESYIDTESSCQVVQQSAASGSSWASIDLCKGAGHQQQCGVSIQTATPALHVRSCVSSTGRHAATGLAPPCARSMRPDHCFSYTSDSMQSLGMAVLRKALFSIHFNNTKH